jgi:RNA polymerase subunit RPABC4/transcription elongation factor Spt4
MKCQRCQNELQPHFNFCPVCGATAKSTCSNCHKEINTEWVSCPFCGTNLKAPQSAPTIQPPVIPPPQHSQQPRYYDRSNSSGNYNRRKKGFLDRFFS